MIHISVINASSVLTDAQVSAAVPALQTQISRDFAPAWGTDAHLDFVPLSGRPAAGSWWLSILDDSDQADALGYHDVTSDGMPLGKVFARSDIRYGYQWTVTASHELLEMLADPDINLCALVMMSTSSRLYAYEVCDPCEADALGYKIGDVLVSDFVLPTWFERLRGRHQVDFCKHLLTPLTLAPGGYMSFMDMGSHVGWQQKSAASVGLHIEMDSPGLPVLRQAAPARITERPRVGSRRERRRTPIDQWRRSAAHA